MKKRYRIENVDCANCALKIEDSIKKIPGVQSASISFITQKLTLEMDDDKVEEILKEAVKRGRKIESDFEII